MKVADGYTTAWQAICAGLAPDPDDTISEWADQHRVLGRKASAEPGRWRTSRTPYLKEIMDALSPLSPVREVTLMKASQLGGSEVGFNWIGHTMAIAPASMLMIQPTEGMLKKVVRQRIDPMIEDCPQLRETVASPRKRDGANNLNEKSFLGGMLLMGGANSGASLRSMPIPRLLLDETDAYPLVIDKEGDTIEIALARTRTFYNRKVYRVSSPTIAGRSRIEEAFLEGTQEYYKMPCPACGHRFHFVMGNLKWDGKDYKNVRYLCDGCGSLLEERQKTELLAAGEWVAKNKDADPLHRSFHINSLYSPVGWFSWAEIAKKWDQAQGKPDKLRVFVNTVLGETYREKGDVPEYEHLYNRRAPKAWPAIPKEAVFLTAGIDVQKDRLELEIVGWGRDLESWGIDYRAIPCDTSNKREVLKEINKLMRETWPHELGGEISLSMIACDAGYNTQVIYGCARDLPVDRFMAIKGMDRSPVLLGRPKAVDVTTRGKTISRGARVWGVGVGIGKSELYGWLGQKYVEGDGDKPTGWCNLPSHYDVEYFKMLCSEQMIPRVVNGYRRYIWEKIRERNEALDCRVYARAAAARFGLDRMTEDEWQEIEDMLKADRPIKEEKAPPKSDFWNGRGGDGWLY